MTRKNQPNRPTNGRESSKYPFSPVFDQNRYSVEGPKQAENDEIEIRPKGPLRNIVTRSKTERITQIGPQTAVGGQKPFSWPKRVHPPFWGGGGSPVDRYSKGPLCSPKNAKSQMDPHTPSEVPILGCNQKLGAESPHKRPSEVRNRFLYQKGPRRCTLSVSVAMGPVKSELNYFLVG